jgi:hypothetical protein
MSIQTGESYTAKLDGKDDPANGAYTYNSVSLKRIDERTIEEMDKRGGKVVEVVTVASDGKKMTVVATITSTGRTSTYVAGKQYLRIDPPPALQFAASRQVTGRWSP